MVLGLHRGYKVQVVGLLAGLRPDWQIASTALPVLAKESTEAALGGGILLGKVRQATRLNLRVQKCLGPCGHRQPGGWQDSYFIFAQPPIRGAARTADREAQCSEQQQEKKRRGETDRQRLAGGLLESEQLRPARSLANVLSTQAPIELAAAQARQSRGAPRARRRLSAGAAGRCSRLPRESHGWWDVGRPIGAVPNAS